MVDDSGLFIRKMVLPAGNGVVDRLDTVRVCFVGTGDRDHPCKYTDGLDPVAERRIQPFFIGKQSRIEL